jgi:hypothetical protein
MEGIYRFVEIEEQKQRVSAPEPGIGFQHVFFSQLGEENFFP